MYVLFLGTDLKIQYAHLWVRLNISENPMIYHHLPIETGDLEYPGVSTDIHSITVPIFEVLKITELAAPHETVQLAPGATFENHGSYHCKVNFLIFIQTAMLIQRC